MFFMKQKRASFLIESQSLMIDYMFFNKEKFIHYWTGMSTDVPMSNISFEHLTYTLKKKKKRRD